MTPLPLLVLEAGSGTKFLTNSANPILWTLFGSHKELGGTSLLDQYVWKDIYNMDETNLFFHMQVWDICCLIVICI
jgi:hypothetical protein